jgi:hypothetical protein
MCRRLNPSASTKSVSSVRLDQTEFLPAYRLNRLIDALKGITLRDTRDAQTGFEVVDKLCHQIWGRSICDNFEEDIDFGCTQLDKFEQALGRDNSELAFMRQYLDARKRCFTRFKSAPAAFCGGGRYVEDVASEVIPKLIFVDGAADGLTIFGNGSDIDRNDVSFFDGSYGRMRILMSEGAGGGAVPLSFAKVYCFDRKNASEGVAFGTKFDDVHWLSGVSVSAYVSLLLNGRQKANGREFAVYRAEETLREAGVSVVYDQKYSTPVMDRNPGYLFDLFNLEHMKCDFSGDDVTRANSIIVSPWEFPAHPEFRQLAKTYKKRRSPRYFAMTRGMAILETGIPGW